jgi:hypothetical protein
MSGLLPAAAPPPPPPWEPAVEQLIQQLGDPEHGRRELAERQLAAEKPRILPLLRKALGTPDAEIRRRALRLIHSQENALLFSPRRLTFSVTRKPIHQVLAEITSQTGYKFQLNGPNSETVYSFEFKNATFWEVLDRICRDASLTVQPYYGQDLIFLTQGNGNSPYFCRDGAFRFTANSFQLYRNIDLGVAKGTVPPQRRENLTFHFTINAEPRLPILGTGEIRVEAAYDNEKNSLLPKSENPEMGRNFGVRMWSSRRYSNGNKQLTMQVNVPLERISEKANQVQLIRGFVPLTLLVEEKPLVVTDKLMSAKGLKTETGDLSFHIEDIQKLPGGQYSVKMTITNSKETGGDQMWMHTLFQRIELLDEKGNKFQVWSTNWNGGGANQVQWTMTFGGNFGGAAKAMGTPTKLVYHHWITRQHDVSFEFRNLPLP